jgi:RNA polymerase sigma-70 factor (ECF subfamily)
MARATRKAQAAGEDAGERLLVEAAQRDPGRFGDLYERHFESVYAYILRRVRERATAEDLTADVFQRALASLPRFEFRGAPFAAWLYRIAANAVATHFEKSARERAAPADPAPEQVEMEETEYRARLFRLVAGLPEAQRRVICLRFAEEKSIREVARSLGKSEGAVKQLQLRALKNLKARVEKSHG